MKTTLVPAILAYNQSEFEKQLSYFDDYVSRVHVDCMDGKFVKNKTWYEVESIRKMKSKVSFDLHIMYSDPLSVIQSWKGEKRLKRCIVHIEAFQKNKKELYDIIKVVKKSKKQIAIAINPSTPVSKILEFVHLVDQVMIMGVNPGWAGQKLILSVLTKIQALRSYYPKLSVSFDGGVTKDLIPILKDYGVNDIVTHSLVYKKTMKTSLLSSILSNYFITT